MTIARRATTRKPSDCVSYWWRLVANICNLLNAGNDRIFPPSLPPSPYGGCVLCCVFFCFFHWGICAALMRSERGVPASLGGFKPPTSVYTHRAPTMTAHAAQLQSHSTVFLLLSFNLQGREGAPRPRHTRLQICHDAERRTPKLAMGRPQGTCRRPHPKKKQQNIEPSAPH